MTLKWSEQQRTRSPHHHEQHCQQPSCAGQPGARQPQPLLHSVEPFAWTYAPRLTSWATTANDEEGVEDMGEARDAGELGGEGRMTFPTGGRKGEGARRKEEEEG